MGVFSGMETEVMLAARGLPDARIAEELGISEVTVERHLANVYQKVEVRSRSEAVRMALKEQWIEIGEITDAADSDDSSGG